MNSSALDSKRAFRTMESIRQAFLRLLDSKEVERITIQEIAISANINRSTVYRYYQDIYDILHDCLVVYCGAQGRVVPRPDEPDYFCKLKGNIRLGAEKVKEHQRLYLVGSNRGLLGYVNNLMNRTIDEQEYLHHKAVLESLGIDEKNVAIPLEYVITTSRDLINSFFEVWVVAGCAEPINTFVNTVTFAYFGYLYAITKDKTLSPLKRMYCYSEMLL
jgi:AcrR family transcriptional regulator